MEASGQRVRTRRDSGRPSYRELSDSDSDLQPTPERASSRTVRQPLSYREPDSDDELDVRVFKQPESPAQVTSPEKDDRSLQDASPAKSNQPRRPRKRVLRSTKSSPRKRQASASRIATKSSPQKNHVIPAIYSGFIPPWTTLPYLILVDIFKYASFPLYDDSVQRTTSIQWLLNTSRLCKEFFEPAMAALYWSPPLLPSNRTVRLLELLAKDTNSTYIDYSTQIHRLDIAVPQILIKKPGPQFGYIDIYDIIKSAKLVKHLELYHDDDRLNAISPPITQISWHYPERLFDALRDFEIHLRSFMWNARFGIFDDPDLLLRLEEIHLSHPAFRSIKSLHMVNIFRSSGLYNDDVPLDQASQDADVRLERCLAALPNLKELRFTSSPIIDENSVMKLPMNLRSLAIVNSDNLSSAHLEGFLEAGGLELEELILDHNKSINLSFLTTLGQHCPNLKVLRMNLTYYDKTAMVIRDVEPHYDVLLDKKDIPNWPLTLVDLELSQLRISEAAVVEMFFDSLIKKAPDLKDLRRLVLKVLLKIGWRDRAKFRGDWSGNLEKTFLRRAPPPQPRFTITKPKIATPAATESNVVDTVNGHADDTEGPKPGETDTADETSTQTRRISRRIAFQISQEKKTLASPQSDSEPTTSFSPSNSTTTPEATGAQAMCDFVRIRIDNLRPAEAQFDEGDFMDSELSGDEDYED